ncbi:MAG: nitrilase-related carbon-nitrogen hydrolase [Caulobacteraceae bacterium]
MRARNLRLGRWALALLSGLALWASLGLHPIWWLAWIAPIPLVWAVLGAGAWEAAALGLLAGVLQSAGWLGYIATVAGPLAAPVLGGLVAVLWAAVAAATRTLAKTWPAPLAVFAYPLAWAAVETLFVHLSPHGTMGGLAVSQMDFLPVMQTAALAGGAGVVFLMSLPASVAAVGLRRWPRPPLWSSAAALGLVAVALVFGAVRLAQPQTGPTLRFGVVSIDRPDFSEGKLLAKAPPGWDLYLNAARSLAGRGAQAVLLPEAIDAVPASRQPRLAERLSTAARSDDTSLIVGVAAGDGARVFNRAWAFGPSGALVADYAKHHPAAGEAAIVTPGHGFSLFRVGQATAGLAICKDMDFPALARRYKALGAEVLFVPAWDFGVDGWMHDRMAAMRGVEDGLYIVRSAEEGVLSVSDPKGRILAAAPSRSGAGTSLIAETRIGPPARTLYSRTGDLFGWLCLAALALSLTAFGVRRPLRRGKP